MGNRVTSSWIEFGPEWRRTKNDPGPTEKPARDLPVLTGTVAFLDFAAVCSNRAVCGWIAA